MMSFKYKVVRTYEDGAKTDELEQAFEDGWRFLRANEFVPMSKYDGIYRYGYIEYILYKEAGDTDGNS